MTIYPYDIVDKVIAYYYPEESECGGRIDTDCGELHSLVGTVLEKLEEK